MKITDLEAIPRSELRSVAQVEARAALIACKCNARAAAAMLGWRPQKVYDIINRWRAYGVLPAAPRRCPVQSRIGRRTLSIGRLNTDIRRTSYEFRAWLAREVPEGGSVAEFLLALAQDIADEEMDG